ncbi:MAG: hypothetical protein U5K54_27715 [Cytophagales bacterium]|nr:hypothetical protein [Cytophagales bacterium]
MVQSIVLHGMIPVLQMHLSLQATQFGLNVHQMGGFDRQKAILNLNIPESHEPIGIMAIGYSGDVKQFT